MVHLMQLCVQMLQSESCHKMRTLQECPEMPQLADYLADWSVARPACMLQQRCAKEASVQAYSVWFCRCLRAQLHEAKTCRAWSCLHSRGTVCAARSAMADLRHTLSILFDRHMPA